MSDRMPWPDYFMRIAHLVAQRSTCTRRAVGAIAVHDKRVLATGYNGVPTNIAHCGEVGCLREQMGIPSGERHELCRGLHAEQNVIIQAATHGLDLKGCDIYCTTKPCILCTKMLINCEVQNIYFADNYPDKLSEQMLDEAGVNYVFMQGEFI